MAGSTVIRKPETCRKRAVPALVCEPSGPVDHFPRAVISNTSRRYFPLMVMMSMEFLNGRTVRTSYMEMLPISKSPRRPPEFTKAKDTDVHDVSLWCACENCEMKGRMISFHKNPILKHLLSTTLTWSTMESVTKFPKLFSSPLFERRTTCVEATVCLANTSISLLQGTSSSRTRWSGTFSSTLVVWLDTFCHRYHLIQVELEK